MTQATRYGATVIYLKSGIKAALEFYQTAFGFTLRYYNEELDFGELDTGATAIMIASHQAGAFMIGPAIQDFVADKTKCVELALTVDDVQACYENAIAAGAISVKAPAQLPWGQTAAYVQYSDGMLIGILTPVEPGL